MADALAKKGVPVILGPAQALPERRRALRRAQHHAGVLQKAGVKFSLSTFNAVRLAHICPTKPATPSSYGLPREEALKAITLYPAQALGLGDRVGTLEPGKIANLIVTTGDPLEFTTEVKHLFINGEPTSLDNKHRRCMKNGARGRVRAAGRADDRDEVGAAHADRRAASWQIGRAGDRLVERCSPVRSPIIFACGSLLYRPLPHPQTFRAAVSEPRARRRRPRRPRAPADPFSGQACSSSAICTAEEDVLIDGIVTGTIDMPAHALTIGRRRRSTPRLRARRHRARHARPASPPPRSSTSATARAITGELAAPSVLLADGARVQARVETKRVDAAVHVARYRMARNAR